MSNTTILNLEAAYDPLKVRLYLGGQRVYGYAPDTKISVSRNDNNITTAAGVDGEFSAALSRNRSGVMTVSLQNTSKWNEILSAWQRQADVTGAVWLPILLEGSQGPSISSFCNIQKQPDVSYGAEVGQMDWELFVVDCWYAPSAATGVISGVSSLLGAV